MQAHSYPHSVRGRERSLDGDRRRDGINRTVENDEEAVPLGIDLVPTMSRHRIAEQTAMLGAEVAVPGTVSARKFSRALDVAEQEGDCPARQASMHMERWYAGNPKTGNVVPDAMKRRTLSCASVHE
jgi:hypothetical protein